MWRGLRVRKRFGLAIPTLSANSFTPIARTTLPSATCSGTPWSLDASRNSRANARSFRSSASPTFQAWLRDQYRHPEEHRHTIAEAQRWFTEHGVEYLRTYPSAVFDDTTKDLLTRAADDWGLESWLTQIAWMRTLGREGGLFFTIGRAGSIASR